jgi:DNA polymerase-1
MLILGSPAIQQFTKDYKTGILEQRGFWNYSEEFECWYYPTIHPANIVRNWQNTSSFYRDIERFTDGCTNGIPKQKLGSNYRIITDLDGVKNLFRTLHSRKRVAWDLETSSLNFWDKEERILGISFCWKIGHAAYIPLYGPEFSDIWSPKQLKIVRRYIKKFLEDPTIIKDGQNTKFDINWERREGVTVRRIGWDTMQNHALIDENTPANLTYLTTYYDLNFPRYENELKPHKVKRKGKDSYWMVPVKVLGKYACADVDGVYRIRRKQLKILDKKERSFYRRYPRKISKFAAEMEFRGALIDIPRIREMEIEYDKKVGKVNDNLSRIVKRDYFNVQSNPQMQEVLYAKKPKGLGLKTKRKTKSGSFSTDKDTFDELERNYAKNAKVVKVLNLVKEVRSMRKMKSTYLTGFRKIVDDNNRVHSSYLTTGTVTGRMASEAPNLQNIPRDKIFRSLFIAGPGRKLISADYSQIEARLMAFLAGETVLIDRFKDPKFDPHRLNSSIVRGKPEDEITKEERSVDKAVTFGINYGRSEKSIAEMYQLELSYVEQFVRNYFKTFSKIAAFRKRCAAKAREDGYLKNALGRKRHFMAWEWLDSEEYDQVKEYEEYCKQKYAGAYNTVKNMSRRNRLIMMGNMDRQAINYPIQSYAWFLLVRYADRLLKAIAREELDAFLVLSVHDANIIEAADSDVKRVEELVNQYMPFTLTNKRKGYEMHFPIDYDISDCWE